MRKFRSIRIVFRNIRIIIMQRIILKNVSKKFKIGFEKNQGTLARFVSLFSGRETKKTIQVLNNISFSARAGEVIGIIGKNGSGKSTLLKIIAEIYNKDGGEIKTNGKITSLINLNTGLKERLTMKDNVVLCCSLFGLSKKEIKKIFNSIIELSELRDFINTKIYQFSEGMKQRLAFAIAVYSRPEILLLDEVFEIGDESFKEKSVAKIKNLVEQGATVLLVSHDLNLIKEHCHRLIWLEKGHLVKQGRPQEIIKEYKNA